MIIFERSFSSQSLSTAHSTISYAVREVISRFPAAGTIGIIASTSWRLVQSWQACIDAGREPIILHFPTPKLSRVYWQDEIVFAIQSAGISLLICESANCAPMRSKVPIVLMNDLDETDAASEVGFLPDRGNIIQMSSGTTGHRKGIRFDFQDVSEHVSKFNEALKLTPADCVVSWLPLYHDMGFVAAFLMPRLLGCKIVMIDPVNWVRRPEMLWELIEEHGGTVCYMPNFGFEVMASRPRAAPTMRKWISCSEPTRRRTMDRFATATGAPLEALANCWGMAENIFAVCISDRITTRSIDETEVTSCGRPIAGVEVKSVDGELFVRSPYSLHEYIGFSISLDEEGFYGSGDLGVVEDGEVYLLGRRHDVINVAGRKTLASDVDYVVAQEVPESAGRIATFAMLDADLGTEVPVILIEHPQFWRQERDSELRRRIIGRTGIESARVHFVPPRFITKTSSGKVNRKTTRMHWLKRAEARHRDAVPRGPACAQARAEIAELFPWLDPAKPVGAQIDSLGLVNLSLVLERFGLANGLAPEMTLETLLTDDGASADDQESVVKIVSIGDANNLQVFLPSVLERLRAQSNRPVQFKHICVPVPPVLLSDLIFMDYFVTRDDRGQEPYQAVSGVLNDLKTASVLIVDEAQAIFWPTCEAQMLYPQLSHDFQSDGAAPTIGLRWARYSEGHDKLACTAVSLWRNVTLDINAAITDLGDYLGVPIVRAAYGRSNSAVTAGWEVQGGAGDVRTSAALGDSTGLDLQGLCDQLEAALERAMAAAPERWSEESFYDNWRDQPHWCSWPVNPALIDYILDHFSAPVVLGKKASVPYLSSRARELGIPLVFRPGIEVPDGCDCVIMTGYWGKPETDKPVFQAMAAGWAPEAANLPEALAAACPPARIYSQ